MNAVALLWAVQWVCASSLPGTAFDFKQDEFHVTYAASKSSSLHYHDVLSLTGQLEDDGGGVVIAKCQNETETHKCSHSIQFSESWYPHCITSEYYRNVSASLFDGQVRAGKATFVHENTGQWRAREIIYWYDQGRALAIMIPGPNGPAPAPPTPPQPPSCSSAFNQSACASIVDSGCIHTCTWCKSTDTAHQSCFTKGHTPEKGWSCNGDNVQNVLVV